MTYIIKINWIYHFRNHKQWVVVFWICKKKLSTKEKLLVWPVDWMWANWLFNCILLSLFMYLILIYYDNYSLSRFLIGIELINCDYCILFFCRYFVVSCVCECVWFFCPLEKIACIACIASINNETVWIAVCLSLCAAVEYSKEEERRDFSWLYS